MTIPTQNIDHHPFFEMIKQATHDHLVLFEAQLHQSKGNHWGARRAAKALRKYLKDGDIYAAETLASHLAHLPEEQREGLRQHLKLGANSEEAL